MTGKSRGNRWYDRYPALASLLEQLREIDGPEMLRIMRGLRDLIAVEAPGLIDRTVLEYPLDVHERRRWYDFDPLSWLTVNAMRYLDESQIVRCIAYLRESLPRDTRASP